jgi:hypothetical protein
MAIAERRWAMRPCSLLLGVVASFAGCRPVVVAEIPAQTTELPELAADCEGTVPGSLSALDGQLVFWPDDSSANSEMVKPLGPPYWSPRTILLPRGTDEWFSTLLPGNADSVLAVRTIYGPEHVEGRDELVEIDRRTLAARVLWAPGHRLLLLGRTGGWVMLLDYDGVDAQVIGFDLGTGEILESAPVDLDLDALTLRPDSLCRSWRLDPNDAGNAWSGCHGPADYFLACRGDRLCRARIEGSAITIAFVDLEPCPEVEWFADRQQRLPVDGQMVDGVHVEIDACKVRSNLYFPALGETPDQACRIEIVEVPEPDSMPWFRELIVGPGCTLSTGFSEHAFALSPERVSIEPLPERGAWRVVLPYPDSAFAAGDCLQGELWLRALDWNRFSRSETWLGWEYGHCE